MNIRPKYSPKYTSKYQPKYPKVIQDKFDKPRVVKIGKK